MKSPITFFTTRTVSMPYLFHYHLNLFLFLPGNTKVSCYFVLLGKNEITNTKTNLDNDNEEISNPGTTDEKLLSNMKWLHAIIAAFTWAQS